MSTKAPSSIQESAPDSLEKIAYTSVADVATLEPNDQYRLGYHVWRWLTTHQGSLEQTIAESGARLKVTREDAFKLISDSLAKQGIQRT